MILIPSPFTMNPSLAPIHHIQALILPSNTTSCPSRAGFDYRPTTRADNCKFIQEIIMDKRSAIYGSLRYVPLFSSCYCSNYFSRLRYPSRGASLVLRRQAKFLAALLSGLYVISFVCLKYMCCRFCSSMGFWHTRYLRFAGLLWASPCPDQAWLQCSIQRYPLFDILDGI